MPRTNAQVTRTPNASGEVAYACSSCATTLETTMVCGPCDGAEKSPVIALSSSGQIVRTCPTCQSAMGLALSKPLAATGKAVGGDPAESTLRATEYIAPGQMLARAGVPAAQHVQLAPQALPPLRFAPAAAAALRIDTAPLTGAIDIASAIRARLGVVDAAIAERKSLEVEAKTLRKTLAAFDRATAKASATERLHALLTVPVASIDHN